MLKKRLVYIVIVNLLMVFNQLNLTAHDMQKEEMKTAFDTATFGSGCFWCSEAIFKLVDGVVSVTSGYAGGDEPNPTYEMVCTGTTGYAEVIQVVFDPDKVSYSELLEIFWKTHDPTTPNRQGADVGPQYRSVIFYHNKKQLEEATYYKSQLEKAHIWKDPLVTEISRYRNFYPAEAYHQNFYEKNPGYGYCNFVITPKLEKFKKVFSEKLAK